MALKSSILIVAGTDPTGGAGIIRDIETAAHFRIKSNLAITSVNVQDDNHVAAIVPMDGVFVAAQMQIALKAKQINAIKIGMTGTQDIIKEICHTLKHYNRIPVVLDPVLSASSGGKLVVEKIVDTMINELFPHTEILTPNLEELSILSQSPHASHHQEAIQQARKLLALGPRYILIKGGHADGPLATDSLVGKNEIINISTPRLETKMRGTGCLLSSAIAVHLALNNTITEAVKKCENIYT
ncbi:Phosphomethylpyrimidine kinase [Bartonella ancashensis]|uniref:hydroxymethylpyrimidine kinase n=1 Tax=Bartonella ancashensis TaxID=1318743 RepID=A0A0M3T382_9HYPH|nr:Phosphomethylpyrimidine kinase [Bartonella ancashensis]